MKKDIAIFALSWREGGICAAGKDISTKKWIRPVTAAGPVPAEQAAGFNLLDVVEMEIGRPLPVHHQSENCELLGQAWVKKIKISKTDLQPYLDSPANLWDTTDLKGRDSLTPQDIINAGIKQSLYLIRLGEMTVSLEEKEYSRKKSKKLYGIFIYNGVNYKLRITDPQFNSLYANLGASVIKNPIICLSLGEVFEKNGRCYKLIAGVIISNNTEMGNEVTETKVLKAEKKELEAKCQNCGKTIKLVRDSKGRWIASLSGLTLGGIIGGVVGAGIGLATGGVGIAATLPFGIAFGTIMGGTGYVVGDKVLDKFKCPECRKDIDL